MILTNSSSARAGSSAVTAIVSVSSTFLQFMCYLGTTVSAAISGATGLVKNGVGGLTLSGVCNYTGQTIINQGNITITSASTLNGVISGSGSLTKNSNSALTIGASNTYSGGTLSQGTAASFINVFASNPFGTGLFTTTVPGAGTVVSMSFNGILSNDFVISASTLQLRVAGTTTVTSTGSISGIGGVNKTSPGLLILQGNLTYTGTTTITAGTLRAFKTIGSSTATASFTNTALSVAFNVSPPSGATTNFQFFQGTTAQTYASVTLTGVPAGTTATYNSANSTLSVTVP